MYLYCVTVSVDSELVQDWLQWMNEVHIPEVLATGYFQRHRIYRDVLPAADTNRGTFRIDYEFQSLEDYHTYQDQCAADLQAKHTNRYAGRFSASRLVVQQI